MKYINKFGTTEEYTQALGKQLVDLEHFTCYTKDTETVYLKKKVSINIITINQLESNPASMISGDVNGEVIRWIRQNSHRVLAKKTGEGTVTYIELDDTDSNKYAVDGSEAKTDGTEGDVFVKLPTFYYSGTEGDNVEIKFADGPFEGGIEWDTNILIGAYEAYYDTESNKLQSRSGVESSGDISQANFKSYAEARGSGYQLVDWQIHCVLGCLFYAMYGNTNSQEICGTGVNSYTKICGETNSLGMEDTKSETNGNTMSINFWGLENWWGNKVEWMQEDNINSEMNTYDPVTKGNRSIKVPNYLGFFVKKMLFGKYLDLIVMDDDPKDGSDSVGYCDYQYWDNSQTNRAIRRSVSDADTYGGVSFSYAYYDSNLSEGFVGSRLAFKGISSKAKSVDEFKQLEVL